MANQTVVVFDNNRAREILEDPQALAEALHTAMSSGNSDVELPGNLGKVVLVHHRYDPALLLSYGGIVKVIGTTEVGLLPHDDEAVAEVINKIFEAQGFQLMPKI